MNIAGTWDSESFCDFLIFFFKYMLSVWQGVVGAGRNTLIGFPFQFLKMFAIDGDSNPSYGVKRRLLTLRGQPENRGVFSFFRHNESFI